MDASPTWEGLRQGIQPTICEHKTPVELMVYELWGRYCYKSPKHILESVWIQIIFEVDQGTGRPVFVWKHEPDSMYCV